LQYVGDKERAKRMKQEGKKEEAALDSSVGKVKLSGVNSVVSSQPPS